MPYFHAYDVIIGPGVGPVRNIRVRVLDGPVASGGDPVTLYDGLEGSPLANNYVTTDQDGRWSLYVAQGFYTLAFYDLTDTLLSSVDDVGFGAYGEAEANAAAAAAALSASNSAVSAAQADAAKIAAAASAAAALISEMNAAASAASALTSQTSATNSAASALASKTAAEAARDVSIANAASAAYSAGLLSSYLISTTFRKYPVRLASTKPLTYNGSGIPTGAQTVDGSATANGDFVLDLHNPTRARCGVYTVNHSGAWTRRSDMNTAALITGAQIVVIEGNVNWAREYHCVSIVTTLETDPVVFESFDWGGAESFFTDPLSVDVDIGDSNTIGRNGTYFAWNRERGHPRLGVKRHSTHYFMANSGMMLATVRGSIAGGVGGGVGEAPYDYVPAGSPQWVGNIWQVVNAYAGGKRGRINCRFGSNDFGLGASNRVTGAPGDPLIFFRNMREVTAFFKTTCPGCIVCWDMPQLFPAEDFIQGVNVTQWATDSPDGTVATGAATVNAKMVGCYRKMADRPGVEVIDIVPLLAQVNSDTTGMTIANKAVDALDPYTGNPYIADGLHATDEFERRREQLKMQRYSLSGPGNRARASDYMSLPFGLPGTVREGYWLHYSGITNSGADTLFTVRASPAYVPWGGRLGILISSNGLVPMHEALTLGEAAEYKAHVGAMRRVTLMRGEIHIYFPATGNEYVAYAVSFSNDVTDSALPPFVAGEHQYVLQAFGVNMASEFSAVGGTENDQCKAFVYVTHRSCVSYSNRFLSGVMAPGTAAVAAIAIPNSYFTASSDNWLIRKISAARTALTDGALTVDAAFSNQGGDNRLVDGSINPGTSYSIGTLTFGASAMEATWAQNQANIDAAVAAGISWVPTLTTQPAVPTFKGGYRLIFTPSITLTRPISVTVRE